MMKFYEELAKKIVMKKVASKGTFVERINENIKNGWKYPKNALVIGASPAGQWGNYTDYYWCDGTTIQFCCAIPSWAGENGKYKFEHKRVADMVKKSDGKVYQLQTFIKNRS